MTRPSTLRIDEEVFRRWLRGDQPKSIQADLGLSQFQYYHSLRRERRRRKNKRANFCRVLPLDKKRKHAKV